MTLNLNPQICDAKKKYDFIFLVDIHDGNPNGDPELDNRPRFDEETYEGEISDVCLKRKIRDYVDIVHGKEPRNEIYILNRGEFLETVNTNLMKACEADTEFLSRFPEPFVEKKKQKELKGEVLTAYFCKRYFDVRAFGAVPGMKSENSTIRGPIQIKFGRTIDPITIEEHSISRVVQSKPSKEGNEEVHGTFGTKYTVRYGLYRFSGHYSPFLGRKTGFTDDDLRLFWEAMLRWPAIDSSAARSLMSVRGLYIFAHDDPFGNAPAQDLFDRITINLQEELDTPRRFADYAITIKESGLPDGVTLTTLVGAVAQPVG